MAKNNRGKNKIVMCDDIFGNLYRIPARKLQFRPSVYGIIVERGKVLLSKIFGGYDLPGGAIELHETIEQALIREIWEETGFKVKPQQLLSSNSNFFVLVTTKQPVNSIQLYYRCKKLSGRLSTKNFDHYEKKYAGMAEWVDINKMGGLKYYSSINIPALIKQSVQ
ncbi:MAG: NUDIX domain-containing protein [Patescibacteria group bacterium]